MELLGSEVPMHRVGDVVMGERTRRDSLGYDASLFVVGRDGALFAVVKSGAFGADIERYGSTAVLGDSNVRHRYLEFADLDE